MAVKKICGMCNRLKRCLNRYVKTCGGSGCQQEKEEPKKRNYTLKLRVTVKKSDHEIKTILKDAAILLKMNMGAEFEKAELIYLLIKK